MSPAKKRYLILVEDCEKIIKDSFGGRNSRTFSKKCPMADGSFHVPKTRGQNDLKWKTYEMVKGKEKWLQPQAEDLKVC